MVISHRQRQRFAALAFATILAVGITADAAEEDLRITEALRERFEDNQRNWPSLSAGQNWESAIEAGVLRWKNRHSENAQSTRLSLPVSSRRRHEISLDVRLIEGPASHAAGLEWALGEGGFNELLLTRSGHFTIVRHAGATRTVVAEGEVGPAFRPDNFNRLTLRVFGPESILFVNGAVVWIGETLTPFGSGVGMRVQAGVTAEFDNLVINYLRGEDAQFAERLDAYRAALATPADAVLTDATPSTPTPAVAGSVALETQESWLREGIALIKARNFEEAERLFWRILASNPDHTAARTQLAWCRLNRQAPADARAHARLALQVDPLGPAALALSAYTAAAENDWTAVERHVALLRAVDTSGTLQSFIELDLAELEKSGFGASFLPRLRNQFLNTQPEPVLADVFKQLAAQRAAQAAGDHATAAEESRALVVASNTLPPALSELRPILLHVAGRDLFNSDDIRRGQAVLEDAYTAFRAPGATAPAYQKIENAVMLAMIAVETANAARAHTLLSSELNAAMALPASANRLKGDFLRTAAEAASELSDRAALQNYANRLLSLRGTGRDPYFEYLGHAFLAVAYSMSNIPSDRQQFFTHAEKALALARTHRMSSEIQAATANLALAHWHSGKKQLARDTYLQSATEAEKQGDYAGAEIALNNLGALQFHGGDFHDAAATFRRAVALTETARAKLSPEERIRFLSSRLSAYQFLVRCLLRAGDAAGVFEVSNAMRGRALAETIAVGEPPAVGLAAFQTSLAADETAIFYTVVGPAELVIQVVDRGSTSLTYVDGRPLLVPLKKAYLDRLLQKRPGYKPLRATVSVGAETYQNVSPVDQITTDDFEQVVELLRGLIDGSVNAPPEVRAKLLPEFLGTFAKMLVQPVAARLGEQRKLILFPDQVLYFVPFEALPVSGGRYLVEQAQVRYSQSAAVWSLLKSRDYPAGRKPFFGMGGALYAAMEEQAPPLDNATRHLQLQVRAQRNAVEGRSQREIYAAIFGSKPMTYLKGSLTEVQVLSRLFPDATVFTGEDMSESRIKAMVRDGSLATYQIVHLATHGFVLPETPELSGVAMTIFPKERDGEDGYLTAPEVARLGLRADLAVLSACDTGRGRIYGGEGVQGLTGSLLMGGANRALVSLWPVSDAGTMRFMTDMYALTLDKGLSYDEAVTVVKRRFIAGDYGEAFRDVHIWAPFVHYGR